jgi:hypothetical protein
VASRITTVYEYKVGERRPAPLALVPGITVERKQRDTLELARLPAKKRTQWACTARVFKTSYRVSRHREELRIDATSFGP